MIRNMIRPNDLRPQINRALSTVGERPLTDSEFESLARDPLAGPIAKYTRGALGLDGLVVSVQQNRRDWNSSVITRPFGLKQADIFLRRVTQACSSKWCKKLVTR